MFLCTACWWTHLLNGQEAISMRFVIWPHQEVSPGLSFVGEPESFLPLKRGRCCEPYTTINTFLLHYPLLHLAFINQNSSAEEALMLEGLRQPPPHLTLTSPSLLQRKPGAFVKSIETKLCLTETQDFRPRFLRRWNYFVYACFIEFWFQE